MGDDGTSEFLLGGDVVADNSAFISYRRETGYPWARLIWDELRGRSVNAFLDLENMRQAGRFDERILTQIKARPYFLPVLTADSLDRCVAESDWVRREIECAIDHGRIIVPLLIPPFDLASLPPDLPPRIADAFVNSNGVTFYSQFLTAALDQLTDFLEPVALPQVELTDDDADFERLVESQVQALPPPTIAPTPMESPEAVRDDVTVAEAGDVDIDADDHHPPADPAAPAAPENTVVGDQADEEFVDQPEDHPQPADADAPAAAPDSTPPDSTVVDSTAPDSTPPDSTVVDSEAPDSTVVDSTVADDHSGDAPIAAATAGEPFTNPSTAKPSNRKTVAIAAAAVALVLGGVAVFALLDNDDDGLSASSPPVTGATTEGEVTGASVTATIDSPTTVAPPQRARLAPNDWLEAGQSIASADGQIVLSLSAAGRLELRDGDTLRWQEAGSTPTPGAAAIMQDDGNFVLYRSMSETRAEDALWASNTNGNPGAELRLIRSDGDAFVAIFPGPNEQRSLWRRPAPPAVEEVTNTTGASATTTTSTTTSTTSPTTSTTTTSSLP